MKQLTRNSLQDVRRGSQLDDLGHSEGLKKRLRLTKSVLEKSERRDKIVDGSGCDAEHFLKNLK